jgi:hypothetical protein
MMTMNLDDGWHDMKIVVLDFPFFHHGAKFSFYSRFFSIHESERIDIDTTTIHQSKPLASLSL